MKPLVVAADGQADRFVVIDGYKRIVAQQQLGRDTVEVRRYAATIGTCAKEGVKQTV